MIVDQVDFITPHISDSHTLDYPCIKAGFVCEYELPRWSPIHIGRFALDISPTRHVVMLWIAATLCIVTTLLALRAHNRRTREGKAPSGFGNGLEALVLYLRNEVILPNVGPHGNGYVPFLLTLFFFILFANLLGLVPYGSTATGNISVTATLAIVTFIVIEMAGIKAQGKAYINTIIFWPHDMSLGMKLFISPILTPIEFVGKLTKPFALAIRLFANMTAGHVVLLALISLIFTFGSWLLVPVPILMALGISVLELFVAFLQAFIFTLLSTVFIGLIREGAH
ncbi:MAG: F-type H+-transporting ATPase subunit a [Gemmatimonadaceae bacterium]|jgi:F-type H+-transporting ATPase subunit a|nr:F-type H+-transporting ATPase subunit a [Gemmatimonadaceae bacterium]